MNLLCWRNNVGSINNEWQWGIPTRKYWFLSTLNINKNKYIEKEEVLLFELRLLSFFNHKPNVQAIVLLLSLLITWFRKILLKQFEVQRKFCVVWVSTLLNKLTSVWNTPNQMKLFLSSTKSVALPLKLPMRCVCCLFSVVLCLFRGASH